MDIAASRSFPVLFESRHINPYQEWKLMTLSDTLYGVSVNNPGTTMPASKILKWGLSC
jgi:hypothetical protein